MKCCDERKGKHGFSLGNNNNTTSKIFLLTWNEYEYELLKSKIWHYR